MTYNQYGNNGYNKGGYNGGYKQNGGYNKANNGGYNTGATQNTANTSNGQNNKVGAIWKRTTKTGMEYLSISINGVNYTAFINNYKSNPNQPDFNIVVASNQPNQSANNQVKANSGYNQNGGYNNGYAQNKGYQKQIQEQEQQNMDAFYAAQNSSVQNNQIEQIDDIPPLPANDDVITVF